MTRRLQASQERIMFPAWSNTSDELHDVDIIPRRRQCPWIILARRAFLIMLVVILLLFVRRRPPGSDATLGSQLAESEIKELGIGVFEKRKFLLDNPWRGAGRRARKDLIVSVSGCGGLVRRAIAVGDNVAVRYAIRSATGKLLDSSKRDADVLVGSIQVEREIDRTLRGLCAGEAVRFNMKDGRRVLLYVESVGKKRSSTRAIEDSLAWSVNTLPGRKGRSCSSTCQRAGLVCEEKGFLVVNNCPRLRETFGCVRCEVAAAGSSGADMPAYVVMSAPMGHARGACLVTPEVEISHCGSKYTYTRRLCPCFEEGVVKKLVKEGSLE